MSSIDAAPENEMLELLHSSTPPERIVAISEKGVFDRLSLESQVAGWKRALPDCRFAANVCEDKRLFLIGFLAAAARGIITLLPHSTAPELFCRTLADYDSVIVLTDNDTAVGDFPRVDLRKTPPAGAADSVRLPASAVVVITFTSGSTGKPAPHPKTWRFLLGAAQKIANRLGEVVGKEYMTVATVPHQHMYGLEHSLFAPLVAGGAFHVGRPYLPDDLRRALAMASEPCVLVTTPPHLFACLRDGAPFPKTHLIVSATAPINRDMALRAEELFGCRLVDIYGCTEAGSLASRETARSALWETLEGIRIEIIGEVPHAVGNHLEESTPLADVIECNSPERFAITGRVVEMVKVGGKRAALGDLNQRLAEAPGVLDGVFYVPDDHNDATGRLLTFVVLAPGGTPCCVMAHLRAWLDPLFLPRRLMVVDRLPRNATGKLTRQALALLAAEYREKARHRQGN